MRDLVITRHVVVPAHELRWRFSRSSGPGGQSVNTSDSRVELSVDIAASASFSELLRQRALDRLGDRLVDGVLTVAASEHRSQLRNREAAMTRMTELLREAVAPPKASRKRTRPTRAARERRIADKKHRAKIKRWRGSRDD